MISAMSTPRVFVVLVASVHSVAALVPPRRLTGQCNFTNAPMTPYFWDPSCPDDGQSLGCLADGINAACRFCGLGDYAPISCPSASGTSGTLGTSGTSCTFENPPHMPFYWDESCVEGKVGCLADGKHPQCRFCGEFPYNFIPCPGGAATPVDHCAFNNEPEMPYFWDPMCADGMLGCKADGEHVECRFCGAGDYIDVKCPFSFCTFEAKGLLQPAHRYYWEPQCSGPESPSFGCLADGIHPECRYCGDGEYANVTCP